MGTPKRIDQLNRRLAAITGDSLLAVREEGDGFDTEKASPLLLPISDATQVALDQLEAVINSMSLDDELISGGKVTWSGTGLTFDVTAAVYKINGVQYSSPGESITLDPSDNTNDRFDSLCLDTTGHIIKITGTPSANPEIPQEDPATQLFLTTIFVQANAVVPVNVNQSIIYDDNTEWAGVATGFTANFNNTINPFTGTKAIDVTAGANGSNLVFTNGSVLSAVNFVALKFYIRLKAALANSTSLRVTFFNNTTQVSNTISITPYGLSKSAINTYQNITINLSAFKFTSSNFNKIRIIQNGATFSAFYLDYIQLQGGITSPGNSGNAIASTSYNAATGVLTLTFTDGSTYSTGDLRGPAGAEGVAGADGAAGPAGADGAAGPAGADGILGEDGQGFNFRGAWVATTAYNAYDVVTYNGSTYEADHSFVSAASFDPLDWNIWAAKGDAGAAGPAGDPGPAGTSGASGAGVKIFIYHTFK